ncbi:unnamed protein product [Tuber melanosporum]|uniref:(Perigord truffle) hypothetical protein n=1 Tax=Tuber melanosporum (strain Mel28) TaxID=656061 RepID=D5GJC0_TUBMM|nr:uncharacterized protein GSTUM_00008932001 [Tuber melanosporum]CAZ84613.1 unnamed protein product [Tuber melanosporum]
MANLSTLRPSLVILLDQYTKLLRSSPKSLRILAATVLCTLFGCLYERRRRRKADEGRGRVLLRRNSAIQLKDGSRLIYVPYKQTTAKVIIKPTKSTTFDAHRRLFLEPLGARKSRSFGGADVGEGPPVNTKPGLNLAFLHQFLSLLSIMIPRLTSKESLLLLLHTFFLISRTYLSLVVARLDGEIVRDLVAGNGKAFSWGIVKWLGVGGPAVYCNAMIKYLQSKISIAFRTRLTRYIHDLYLNDRQAYYKLGNLDGGLTGGGADQFITSDLPMFCDSAAALYSSLGKPFLDLVVFNYQLMRSLGPMALAGITLNYGGTAWMLKKFSPPFGRLAAAQAKREGDFRGLHTRLIGNAEEVAFYGGADMEKVFLEKGFKDLKQIMEGIYNVKIQYNMLEDFVLKYSWSAFGYLITSLPVFLPAWGGLGGVLELAGTEPAGREKDRMKGFITNKRLMLSLADAGGRMMYSFKDLSELAGYTSRVYTLVSTLHRVHSQAYSTPRPELYGMADIQGTLHKGYDGVRLEGVPIVAPGLWPRGGEELVESLDVTVREGEHLLILGPNGVGKSSIARIVAGLWPVYRGLVSRPRGGGMDGIMFLPQRVYLAQGTLRDQVIYPHTEMEMRADGRSDHELKGILDAVRLRRLPDREGGWDCRKEWKDVLSGGEKQRISLARLLYHEPKYAFIDEGTSAVSQDVEGLLYETAKEHGITLITISSRAQLKKYHTFQLQLDGGGWEFDRIGTERERSSVEHELRELKEKMKSVEGLRDRLKDIEDELARVFVQGGEELPAYEETEQGSSELGESAVVVEGEGLEPAKGVDMRGEGFAGVVGMAVGMENSGQEEEEEKGESSKDASEPAVPKVGAEPAKPVDLENGSFADTVGTDPGEDQFTPALVGLRL